MINFLTEQKTRQNLKSGSLSNERENSNRQREKLFVQPKLYDKYGQAFYRLRART